MKKYFLLINILLISSIFLQAADEKNYGKEITLNQKTQISEIMADPESFVGKNVLVEGLIVDVCEMRGCWIDLASDKEYESIRIKVNDGEIVFPIELKGETALVEGEVYSFEVENETECAGKESQSCSDEKKSDKTQSCCTKTKEVKKVYQIKGHGAVI